MGVLGVAIYVEDKYLPELALRVGLDQVARLHIEVDQSPHFAICKSYAELVAARQAGKIAFLITMEGVEPLGADLTMLRVFYELGVRSIGLTHARRNMAGDGGVFAASGSSKQGLTPFGKAVVQECEALGIMLDLAHLNPSGVEDVLALTQKPPIISHSTPRHYYDIERNSSDDNLRELGKRGGVIGLNAVLVSPREEDSHLDRYVDEIEYAIELAGVDSVGLGFDFFDFIYQQWTAQQKAALEASLTKAHFLPDLLNHSHSRNLTRKLITRGFDDTTIEKILYGNWMRVFAELL
jgi:membrane dipeptidase